MSFDLGVHVKCRWFDESMHSYHVTHMGVKYLQHHRIIFFSVSHSINYYTVYTYKKKYVHVYIYIHITFQCFLLTFIVWMKIWLILVWQICCINVLSCNTLDMECFTVLMEREMGWAWRQATKWWRHVCYWSWGCLLLYKVSNLERSRAIVNCSTDLKWWLDSWRVASLRLVLLRHAVCVVYKELWTYFLRNAGSNNFRCMLHFSWFVSVNRPRPPILWPNIQPRLWANVSGFLFSLLNATSCQWRVIKWTMI